MNNDNAVMMWCEGVEAGFGLAERFDQDTWSMDRVGVKGPVQSMMSSGGWSVSSTERADVVATVCGPLTADVTLSVALTPGRRTRIGRLDPRTGEAPAVNLTALDKLSSVSRRHAELRLEGGRVFLVDVGSKNGTRVNGERLQAQEAPVLMVRDGVDFGNVAVRIDAIGIKREAKVQPNPFCFPERSVERGASLS